MSDSFADVPKEYIGEFKETMGVCFEFGKHKVSNGESVAVLVAAAVIFFGLAVANLSRKKRSR